MKQFWLCSEFWTAVIPAVFGILVTTGVVTPEKATELTKNIMAIVGALMTIIPAVAYSKNRTALKQSVVDAVAYDRNPVDPDKLTAAGVRMSAVDRIKSAGI